MLRICTVPTLLALGLLAFRAAPSARADIITLDVTGNIDTGDELLIQGSTLQWFHDNSSGAAVGRHLGNNFPTTITTSLNGVVTMDDVSWTPTWPNAVPDEIRFVAHSSIFDTLSPVLPPTVPTSVGVSVVSGRGNLTISQLPTAANAYQLIVRYADGFNGSADLDGQITINTAVAVPEPASMGVASAGALLLLLLKRRRGRQRLLIIASPTSRHLIRRF